MPEVKLTDFIPHTIKEEREQLTNYLKELQFAFPQVSYS